MNRPIILTAIIAILIIPFIYSVSFISSPNIITNPSTTATTLECEWIASGDTTQQNYTWYNGSNPTSYNDSDITSPAFLPSGIAKRGETWYCVVDLYNGSDTVTLNDSVEIENARPTEPILYLSGVDQGNTTVVYEDTLYNFDVNSSDPDGDIITYSDNNAYGWSINSGEGTFSWTPQHTDSSNNVTFDADDGQSIYFKESAKIEFTIIYVNDSPSIETSLTNQTAIEGVIFVYNLEFDDEENDETSFSINYTQVNGDGSLSSLVINKIDDDNANITFNRTGNAATFDERGNYSVTIVAYDPANTSRNDSGSFNLEIIAVNQLPVLDLIPNASGTQGVLFTLEINSTDNDSDDSSSFDIAALGCGVSDPWSIVTTNSSANGTGTINVVLSNDHIICPDVNISVTDGSASDSQIVYFNLTNANDAPNIYDYSNTASNTGGNNLSNLTGASGAQFTYTLNYTDIDSLTYEGESLTIQTNESLFPISNSGLINFTLNNSHVGNWSVRVNVTDDGGLYDEEIIIIEILTNTVPSINNLSQNTCQEDVLCTVYISATDPDPNENITFSSNSSMFNISYHNESAAIMQTTYTNTHVGTVPILITATDVLGAVSNRSFSFVINNSNDPPIFDMDQDDVSDNISLGLIVESYNYYYIINVSDEDLVYGDVLTFNWTTLAGNVSVFNLSKTSTYQATINFTPQSGNAGNYSVNITVTDSANNTAWNIVNFTIEPRSGSPVINHVRPWMNASGAIFALGTNTFGSGMDINFSENRTVTFDVNATDPNGDNLTYTWTYNGNSNGTGRPKLFDFDFFSSGTHTVSVVVEDDYFETSNFEWNITVSNNNRAPQLLNDLADLTGSLSINTTENIGGYFSLYNGSQRLYDPDDDPDDNLKIEGNETFRLTVSAGACVDQVLATVATFAISGSQLTVTPVKIGTCEVEFTAIDTDGASVLSNNVTVNVTQIPSQESTTSETSSSTSGGTRIITDTVIVPLTQEVDAPTPLKIITPGKVVFYKEKILSIPIIVKSNWSETLFGINIEVESNNSIIDFNLSRSSIPSLEPGESENISLTVTDFREGGPYEILIKGTVDEPSYSDEEIILINSIEAAGDTEEYETKIAFAKDFFNENKECQELNEVLSEAEKSAGAGNFVQAIEYVDAAINGCKYLASQVVDIEDQKPGYFRTLRDFTKEYAVQIIIGSGILLVVSLGIFFTRKNTFE